MKSRFFVKSLGSVLLASVAGNAFGADSDVTSRLMRLDGEMQYLNEESRQSRWVGTGIFGALGAGFGVAAVVTDNTNNRDAYAVGSVLSLGVGALIYFLPRSPETRSADYLALAAGTDSERRERVAKGEVILEGLAESERRGRYIAGSLMGAIGAAYLIAGATHGKDSSESKASYLWSGALFSIVAITDFFFERPAERSYDQYKRGGSKDSLALDWKLQVIPTPQTPIAANFSLNF